MNPTDKARIEEIRARVVAPEQVADQILGPLGLTQMSFPGRERVLWDTTERLRPYLADVPYLLQLIDRQARQLERARKFVDQLECECDGYHGFDCERCIVKRDMDRIEREKSDA